MKRTLILMVMALSLFAIAGCSTATAEQPKEYTFTYVHDWSEPKEPQGMVRIMQEMNARANETAQEPALDEEVAQIPVYEESGSYSGYDETLNNNPAYIMGNRNGLNSFDGVYEFNGKTETYYSNRAVYDDQLWVDDDGFWRTDDGHYVVASVDYAEGTEIEISQGKAIVMDGGNEPGNVDVHTTWGR